MKWKTSNKKIAAIKKSGKYGVVVTGKKAGKATITAKVGKESYKCKVTVKAQGLTKTSLTIKKGKQATIRIVGAKKVTWSTSNKKIAKIVTKTTKTVKIKGMKAGTATIQAKIGKKTYKCRVKVTGKKSPSKATTQKKKATNGISYNEKDFLDSGYKKTKNGFVKQGKKPNITAGSVEDKVKISQNTIILSLLVKLGHILFLQDKIKQ